MCDTPCSINDSAAISVKMNNDMGDNIKEPHFVAVNKKNYAH